jgi:hypothetical protein
MSATSLDDVRHALRINDAAAVIGLRECAWLDVKSGPYRLDSATGKEELVKDVTAFANAVTGGLLLIGFKTQVEDGEEVVSELGPIPKDKVDLDQHRKIIRTRVMPPPRGVTVEWIDCGDARGVLVIDIPAQSLTRRPFVVPGPSGNDKASERSVAVPVREADGTHWLPQSEIRRLLALGWAEAGGPSEEVLSALVTTTDLPSVEAWMAAANAAPRADYGEICPGLAHLVLLQSSGIHSMDQTGQRRRGSRARTAGRLSHRAAAPVVADAWRGRGGYPAELVACSPDDLELVGDRNHLALRIGGKPFCGGLG